MITIWKFPLLIAPNSIFMPRKSEILCVQVQKGIACLWAKVEDGNVMEQRIFDVLGTGHPIPDNYSGVYIGTFQISGGDLVFHVFERLKKHIREINDIDFTHVSLNKDGSIGMGGRIK